MRHSPHQVVPPPPGVTAGSSARAIRLPGCWMSRAAPLEGSPGDLWIRRPFQTKRQCKGTNCSCKAPEIPLLVSSDSVSVQLSSENVSHAGNHHVEREGAEAGIGTEPGDRWTDDGRGSGRVARPVGAAGLAYPGGVSKGGRRRPCPRQPGTETSERPGARASRPGAGARPDEVCGIQPPAPDG